MSRRPTPIVAFTAVTVAVARVAFELVVAACTVPSTIPRLQPVVKPTCQILAFFCPSLSRLVRNSTRSSICALLSPERSPLMAPCWAPLCDWALDGPGPRHTTETSSAETTNDRIG